VAGARSQERFSLKTLLKNSEYAVKRIRCVGQNLMKSVMEAFHSHIELLLVL
jgi:hypothetical protein